MRQVGLVTYRGCPQLTEDDQLLISRLRELDIEASALVWDDPTVNWVGFDQVIIRSTWDYHLRLSEFFLWLAKLESDDVALQNPAPLIRWNADKRYLRELAELGIAIPETCWLEEGARRSIRDILTVHRWDRAVIKPTVSATAYNTRYVARGGVDEVARGPLMVQQFLPEISTAGEWSLVFINGAYSHSVRKYPAAGDFRVQMQFGGRVEIAMPSSEMISAAENVLQVSGKIPCYARVDCLECAGNFVLMELELIEPVLFLRLGEGVGRFAHAIQQALFRQESLKANAVKRFASYACNAHFRHAAIIRSAHLCFAADVTLKAIQPLT